MLSMLAFPGGRHDDQVDSVSQFLGWISRRPVQENVPCGPMVLFGMKTAVFVGKATQIGSAIL